MFYYHVPESTEFQPIVSFRIDEAQSDLINSQLRRTRPVGVRTRNQMARKIVTDFLEGKLVYLAQPSPGFTARGVTTGRLSRRSG